MAGPCAGEDRLFALDLLARLVIDVQGAGGNERRVEVELLASQGLARTDEGNNSDSCRGGDLHACADVTAAARNRDGPSHRLERRRANRLREAAHFAFVLTARAAALQMGGDHRALELRQLSVEPDGDLATNPFTHKRPNRSHAHTDEPGSRELDGNVSSSSALAER